MRDPFGMDGATPAIGGGERVGGAVVAGGKEGGGVVGGATVGGCVVGAAGQQQEPKKQP